MNLGRIPSGGGRSCQFNLLANGLDDVGNSIGSTLHRFDLALTGGFTGNDVDNSLKISEGSGELCVTGEVLEVGSCTGEEAAPPASRTEFCQSQLAVAGLQHLLAAEPDQSQWRNSFSM